MFLLGCLISTLNLIISNPKSLIPSSMPQVLFSFSISVKGYFFLPVFRQKNLRLILSFLCLSHPAFNLSVYPISSRFKTAPPPTTSTATTYPLGMNDRFPLSGLLPVSSVVFSPSSLHSCIFRFFVTPWTSQSMEFSRPEYWSG